MKLSIKAILLGGYLIVVGLAVLIVAVVIINLKTIERASDALLYEQVPIADHTMGLIIEVRNEQQLLTD